MANANKSNTNFNALPENALIKLPQVLALYPVSKSSWYAGIKSGLYPHGVKLSTRSIAWKAEDIRNLLNSVA